MVLTAKSVLNYQVVLRAELECTFCFLQVMPGLLLCFVLRYDAYKRSQLILMDGGIPPPPTYVQKVTYFHCSLVGYFLGKFH